jgi:hypothetical protein
MSSEQVRRGADFGIGSTCVSALVGIFSDDGANIVYRNLKADSFNPDNIALDFCDQTIVKKHTHKGESYVR